ncbi:MAG: hypothetical protein GY899_12515 [Verrucomicrobiaceae bacterium]|nr:hypothetical protein [Verrucomicrobiaceae bacterium]
MDRLSLLSRLLAILLLPEQILQSAQSAGNDGEASTQKKLKLWNQSTLAAWWQEHQGAEEIISGTRNLLTTLQSAQQRHGLARVLANEHFLGWLRHLAWIRLFPSDFSSDGFFSRPENFAAFRSLSSRRGLPELVVSSMSCRDDPSGVLRVLCEIEQQDPDDLGEFSKLAIAFALVWDQPFPSFWPHPRVTGKNIPRGDESVAKRFSFMVDSMRNNRLVMDPRRLSVRELTFAVDTPVELRELAYVQQIELRSARKLEQLYRVVPYDHARIQNERYTWPHGAYRLIDIGSKKGGICMDQAYFVAHAGKSMGIPTVLFMGQGQSGDHAWVGFLTGQGQWTLDAARWKGENYPVGLAFDPQSWRRFSDQQMEYSIKSEGDSPAVARGRLILAWAALNINDPSYPAILHAAASAMPRAFEPWDLEAEWLEDKEADLAAISLFWKRWIAHFSGEREMKAKGQRALLRILRKRGEQEEAERLGKQIIAENKSRRFDLGIAVAADEILEKQHAGKWKPAAQDYRLAMQRFGGKAGGHLFYNLVQPYVQTCLSEGQTAHARSAIDHAMTILKPQPNSILANDLRKLRGQAQ